MSVTGKVVIVTGVSSGIGRAVCEYLIAGGAKVVGLDIQALPSDFPVASSVESSFIFHQCDLTKAGAAEEAVSLAVSSFGRRIDGLVNNAGVMDNMASVDKMDDAIYERVIAVNLTAPLKLMRAVVPKMKEQETGGAIVNLGSQASQSGALSGVAYASSKHAIVGATKNVAWRFRNEGIRCNAVLPGSVPTAIYKLPQPVDEDAWKEYSGLFSIHTTDGKNSIPATECAAFIGFLLSDASKSISGAALPIDMAWSAV